MATEILIKNDTAFVWADSVQPYVDPTTGGVLTRTHQIDLDALADAAARQGAKADLGATRAKRYRVVVGIELDVAAVSGTRIDFYWAASPSGTAGEVNPGGCSGADAAYTGTGADSLDDSLKQLEYIGSLILTADIAPTVQYAEVGVLKDLQRYGMPVVDNNSGQALEGDAVEMFVALIPIVDESQ